MLTLCGSSIACISYHNCSDRLRLANQMLNTNYIISQENVWNVDIANLTAKSCTLLDVNISVSTHFMELKLCKFICIVVLYLHTMFWANLRHGQKIDWKALTIFYDLKRPQKTRNYVFQQGIVVLDFFG